MKNKPAAMQGKERIENNMPRQKKINNELINQKNSENENLVDGSFQRKRGRPTGSKDITKRKTRKDNSQLIVPAEDRQRIVAFNNILFRLPKITDRNNATEIMDRIDFFLSLCQEHSVMPTVAGLALALGINRATLWTWINNTQNAIKNHEVIDILKSVYFSINSQYEMLLTEGKMIPVSAFFLMQNNYGYKQQTDHVIIAEGNTDPTTEDITNKAGLLN